MRDRRRGSMMLDLLVGCVIALLTGAALVSLQQSTYMAQATVQGQNYANAASRRPLEILSDTLRNAQMSGNQALAEASASDVTCYTATGYTRIWLDANAHILRRTRTGTGLSPVQSQVGENEGGGGGNTNNASEPLVTNVQSLQLTYYVPAGNAYNADVGSWTTTADPHSPSDAELPSVGAVGIVTTITADGETRTLQNFVRLRNSPPPPTS